MRKKHKDTSFLKFYIEEVLPKVGPESLPIMVGNMKGPFAANPILEIDTEYFGICIDCERRDQCSMYNIIKYIEANGGKLIVDRCKSFKPINEEIDPDEY